MTAQPRCCSSFPTVDFPAPVGPTRPTVRAFLGRRIWNPAARISRLYTARPTPRFWGIRANTVLAPISSKWWRLVNSMWACFSWSYRLP